MNKDEYANMYNHEEKFWWYKVLHELVLAFTLKITKSKKAKILDAGCGTGRMMELMSPHGNIEGVDFSEAAIAFAKKRGLENVSVSNLNTCNLGSNLYDIIISLDVLYHVGIEDDQKVLQKFYHALKPGGYLILNLAAFESLRRAHDKIVHTKRRYYRKSFKRLAESTGYSVLRATYRMPCLYCLIRLKKLIEKDTGKEPNSDLRELSNWVNGIFIFIGRMENMWIKTGLNFPIGSSLFMVLKKHQN